MQLACHLDFFKKAIEAAKIKVMVLEEKIKEAEGLFSEVEIHASEVFQGFQE